MEGKLCLLYNTLCMNSRFLLKFTYGLLSGALLLASLTGCTSLAVKPEAMGAELPISISVRNSPDLSLQLNKLVPEVKDSIRISGTEFCFCTEDGAVRKLLPSGLLGYESMYPKSDYMREQLSDGEKLIYDAFLYGAENGYSRVCFSVEGEVDVSKCYAYLACDDPFIETNYALSISRCTVSLGEEEKLYYCVASTAAKPGKWSRKLLAYEEAKRIVDHIPEDCRTDYDRALYLYRYLADNVEYISDVDYIERGSFLSDTLINLSSNCDGYANALSLLYSMVGIECIVAMGDLSTADGVGHAWNLAKLDGVWYSLDATYDATFAKKEETGKRIFYFLTTDERVRQEDCGYIEEIASVMPPCTDGRYFRMGIDVDSKDVEDRELVRRFKEAVEEGDGVLVIRDESLLGADAQAITRRFDELASAIDFSVRVGGFGIQDLGLLVLYRIS